MCTKEVFDDYLEKKKTMTPLELAKYVSIKQHVWNLSIVLMI